MSKKRKTNLTEEISGKVSTKHERKNLELNSLWRTYQQIILKYFTGVQIIRLTLH